MAFSTITPPKGVVVGYVISTFIKERSNSGLSSDVIPAKLVEARSIPEGHPHQEVPEGLAIRDQCPWLSQDL
jgi:hypothetical protein